MSQRWHRWNRQVLVSIVLIVVLLAGMNLLVDPYEVFHTGIIHPASTTNERFNKIQFILDHPDRFDAFFIGSSRMGVFNPEQANQLRPGRSYYNLSAFSGTSQDALLMLKFLNANGIAIKEVVYGLDIFPFITSESIPSDISLRHHPAVLGQSPISYFSDYLFSASWFHALGKLKAHITEPLYQFHFDTDGRWELPVLDRRIEHDHLQYVKDMFKPPNSAKLRKPRKWEQQRFAELRALIDWLKDHDIQLFAFVHPFSEIYLQKYHPSSLREIRQQWNDSIPGLVDFSLHPDITHNPYLYYEEMHYRPVVAARIVDQLLGLDQPPRPAWPLAVASGHTDQAITAMQTRN